MMTEGARRQCSDVCGSGESAAGAEYTRKEQGKARGKKVEEVIGRLAYKERAIVVLY